MRKLTGTFFALAVGAVFLFLPQARSQQKAEAQPKDLSKMKGYGTHFQTSDRCVACHNSIATSTGEDISIGVNWRTSMMGNGARDPYWMAGVRRELTDHPSATKLINDECTICHMPMMRYEAKIRPSRTCRRILTSYRTAWRTMAYRVRCATRLPRKASARPRAMWAASRSTKRRRRASVTSTGRLKSTRATQPS